jgi:hypothetical protein
MPKPTEVACFKLTVGLAAAPAPLRLDISGGTDCLKASGAIPEFTLGVSDQKDIMIEVLSKLITALNAGAPTITLNIVNDNVIVKDDGLRTFLTEAARAPKEVRKSTKRSGKKGSKRVPPS